MPIAAQEWLLQGPGDQWVTMESADVGFAPAAVGIPERFRNLPPALRANIFKINSLRLVGHTAPYFHDNAAANPEEVVDPCDRFFHGGGFDQPQSRIERTARDGGDIVAYLKLS